MRIKVRKLVLCYLVACVVGCQKNELPTLDNDIGLKAKEWYDLNHSPTIEKNQGFYGIPDWENMLVMNGEVLVPLKVKSNSLANQLKNNNSTLIHAKSFIVLEGFNNGDFVETLRVYVSNDLNKINSKRITDLSFIEYNAANITSKFYSNGEIQREIKMPSIQKDIAARSDCNSYSVIRTDTYTDGSVEVTVLFSYLVCDEGMGGSGSGNSAGGTTNNSQDAFLVASCKSFEYANGILQKAAGVKNIQNLFVAAGIDTNGDLYHAEIELNITAAYFTLPKSYTNGSAANATATALTMATAETNAWFLRYPRTSGASLGRVWDQNIKAAMRALGGTYSKNKPPDFRARSLANYVEEFVWDKTDCSK